MVGSDHDTVWPGTEAARGCVNTDRELWREHEGDYYADSLFVTQSGAIGMNVGGSVIVKPLKDWFALAAKDRPNAIRL